MPTVQWGGSRPIPRIHSELSKRRMEVPGYPHSMMGGPGFNGILKMGDLGLSTLQVIRMILCSHLVIHSMLPSLILLEK